MKKHLIIIFSLFLFFYGRVNSQGVNLEIKVPFSGEATVSTNNLNNIFKIQQGVEIEGVLSFTTAKKHEINTGVSYFSANMSEEREVQVLSGVFKAGGGLFSKFFTEEDLRVMFFVGGRPGIGRYVFNSGDDIYISLGIEAGFKIKYKNFYATLFRVDSKGIQEPKGGANKYNFSYLGVSLGVILL